MQSLFVLLVLVALVVCAVAQWPYYGGYYTGYNGYVAPPVAYNYYGAYNPALSYLWKKVSEEQPAASLFSVGDGFGDAAGNDIVPTTERQAFLRLQQYKRLLVETQDYVMGVPKSNAVSQKTFLKYFLGHQGDSFEDQR
ncbi:uncharacterized protein TNCT_433811 [Trichonephila clavata]|uniref:Uncharacterized protein n=1 Tax=Trichonephila clavata TaxID=2740835 RepID=A0A8X6KKZ9_TRICU|nr:uncharacterized protein TNCT_433811 [Trichonephila clavata]